MNSQPNSEINLRQVLSLRAFKELLKNPPNELYNSIGKEGFLEIANFLSNIPEENKSNLSAMVKYIGSYCYQPGHEVLKEFYLKTYQSINSEDIQAVVKKTGDPDDEADAEPITERILDNEGRDICQDLQKWANEIDNNQPKTTEDDNQPAS